MGYKQITQEQAKSIIDSQKNIVILDVRTKQEFVAEHIPIEKMQTRMVSTSAAGWVRYMHIMPRNFGRMRIKGT